MSVAITLPPARSVADASAQPMESGPLTPAHHQALAAAKLRRKKLNRALGFAAFNTWSFAVMAGFSLLIVIFSPSSLVAVVCFGLLAFNEHRGRRQLKQFDPRGPRTLGWNQLAFCGLIALYCVYQIVNTLYGPDPYAQQIAQTPELAQMLDPMRELITTATLAAYGGLLVIGVGLQALMAWYYFSRQRVLQQYLRETPGWVIELERQNLVG